MLLERQRGRVEQDVDVAGDEIGGGLPGAAIGDHRELGADRLLEQQSADMARRADAGIALAHLVGVGLQVGDEFLQVGRGRRLLGHDQERLRGDQRDRLEVLHQIELQIIDRAARDVGAPLADRKRVAVGRRTRDAADADRAARAGGVLDDDRLTEMRTHSLGHQAADHVGRSADAERDHKRDRAVRVGCASRP